MPKGLIRVPDSVFFDEKRVNAFERKPSEIVKKSLVRVQGKEVD
jgi:hypothetical protein